MVIDMDRVWSIVPVDRQYRLPVTLLGMARRSLWATARAPCRERHPSFCVSENHESVLFAHAERHACGSRAARSRGTGSVQQRVVDADAAAFAHRTDLGELGEQTFADALASHLDET